MAKKRIRMIMWTEDLEPGSQPPKWLPEACLLDVNHPLANGDDLGVEIHKVADEFKLRMQANWPPAAAERVIVGPPPLRLVKGEDNG